MPKEFKVLSDDFLVSPQISAADVGAAAEQGVKLIINNRPDGESPDQPASAEIERAAQDAGLAYLHLPVDKRGITLEHLAAFNEAVNDAGGGKTLGFCLSGMRSVLVRSYAAASNGAKVEAIIAEAANAGYDISAHAGALAQLASGRG